MAFALMPRPKRKSPVLATSVHTQKSRRRQHTVASWHGYEESASRAHAALPTVPAIQTRLRIGEPNDQYEQEADRVADEVMRMPAPEPINQPALPIPGSGQRIQRLCPEGEEELHRQPLEEEEGEEMLQPKAGSGRNPGVTPGLETRLNALPSRGQLLPQSLRAFFEPRFGHDLGRVRLHTDPQAGMLARKINARAFTVKHDVVFASGQYSPNAIEGRHLLAHELTHVIQQTTSPHDGFLQRSTAGSKSPAYSGCTESTALSRDPHRELERARDRAADYLDVTISKLAKHPTKDEKDRSYRTALKRHFISPSSIERGNIRANLRKMRSQLKPENIHCASSQKDLEYCDKEFESGVMGAFARGGKTFLCMPFWLLDRTCMAIILIHEAAHAIGIGSGGQHPPYRGSSEYPTGAKPPGAGETTSLRMDNPDAYAYFSAHIWRDTDRGIGCDVGEIIKITESIPVETMLLIEQAEECAKREALSPFCISVMQEALKKGWRQDEN